jgi:anti-anti-sigma factor
MKQVVAHMSIQRPLSTERIMSETKTTPPRRSGGVRMLVYEHRGVTRIDIEDYTLTTRADITAFVQRVEQVIDDRNQPRILIAMDNVVSVSSQIVGELFALDKKIRAKGGMLRLANVKGEVRTVFTVTQLDRMIKVFDNIDDAIKSFRPRSFLRKLFGK